MLKDMTREYPPGSVKDCVRYDGPLKDWIASEEEYLAGIQQDFRLYGFDHVSMFVEAIFPMLGAVQPKYIHGGDFFGPDIFVEYDAPNSKLTDEKASHHSGWRLLRDPDKPHGIVMLSVFNPNTGGVEILIEGDPGNEWIEEVLRAYYTARRTAAVMQSRIRSVSRSQDVY